MKSYLQGMITGGVLVFAIFVLMGQAKITKEDIEAIKKATEPRWKFNKYMKEMGVEPEQKIGTYQITQHKEKLIMLNTTNGVIWRLNEGMPLDLNKPFFPFKWTKLINHE